MISSFTFSITLLSCIFTFILNSIHLVLLTARNDQMTIYLCYVSTLCTILMMCVFAMCFVICCVSTFTSSHSSTSKHATNPWSNHPSTWDHTINPWNCPSQQQHASTYQYFPKWWINSYVVARMCSLFVGLVLLFLQISQHGWSLGISLIHRPNFHMRPVTGSGHFQ